MSGKWKQAVWEAVQRQAQRGPITRASLIEFELDRVIREVGSIGQTPHQTLSRELQELRDAGVILFDGKGRYRIANGLTGKPVSEAIATEVWRYQKARRGQGTFREKLMRHWGGRCPITGIAEPALLRASHIIPWNRCASEEERLDPDNGLLLSPLWDAAFDRGLVSFGDEGEVVAAASLSAATQTILLGVGVGRISGLTAGHRGNLAWHRENRLGAADMLDASI